MRYLGTGVARWQSARDGPRAGTPLQATSRSCVANHDGRSARWKAMVAAWLRSPLLRSPQLWRGLSTGLAAWRTKVVQRSEGAGSTTQSIAARMDALQVPGRGAARS
jgi:hypothetical protein